MKTLYIDNYKGFVKSFIPILDVNFFVGENSTGKTSILNLINILADPGFWIIPDFNNRNVELGYFDEIVNQHSKNKTFFSIGIEFNEKKSKMSPNFFWMRFKNRNNIPSIAEYMSVNGDNTVLVSFNNKSIYYQSKKYSGESFTEWVKNDKFDSPKKRVAIPVMKTIPLGLVRSIVDAEITGHQDITSARNMVATPIFNNLIWFAPIRAKAKRTYDSFKQSFSPDGEHAPFLLRKLLSSNSSSKATIINALNKFGKDSALYDEINIEEFGKAKKGAPFALSIKYDSLAVKITNVGYGVSQIIPLVIEIATSKGDMFVIQQPEVHLHPKAQSAFGDFLFQSATDNKNKFLIETHSDFTINRFRYNIFKSQNANKTNGQVVYFERFQDGIKITLLPFNEKGQYPDSIPDSFGKFFIDEELKMLEF